MQGQEITDITRLAFPAGKSLSSRIVLLDASAAASEASVGCLKCLLEKITFKEPR